MRRKRRRLPAGQREADRLAEFVATLWLGRSGVHARDSRTAGRSDEGPVRRNDREKLASTNCASAEWSHRAHRARTIFGESMQRSLVHVRGPVLARSPRPRRTPRRHPRQFTAGTMWALKRLGDPAITPGRQTRGGAGDHLRHRREQGPHRPVAGPGGGRPGPPAHQRQGQRHAAHREPGRQVDRVRLEARRRHRKPGLRDRGRWRRSPPRHQPAHRRVGAEMVSRQQAHRIRERNLAGSRALGRPGRAQEGTRIVEDDRARVDARADLATSITSSTTAQPHLFSISIDGGEPTAITRMSGF